MERPIGLAHNHLHPPHPALQPTGEGLWFLHSTAYPVSVPLPLLVQYGPNSDQEPSHWSLVGPFVALTSDK